MGFIRDSEGEPIDGEGAHNRFAVEGDVGVDERSRLAREGRGQGLRFLTGPFGFAAFGGSAQGDRRLAFRIRTCTVIRNGAFRSFFRI